MNPIETFNWGLIGPGGIAHRFAAAVNGLPGARLQAVLARDAQRGATFARQWAREGTAVPTVHTELQALLADPSVQAVYIATPHDSHARLASACLRAGKPVLCEKPLTPTLAQTHALIELSATHRVFLMEALWSRFLPVYDQVAQWLRSGTIGAVRTVQSSFCFNLPFDAQHRVFNPQLAGGAMLDIGIYNLALTRFMLESSLGACPEPERIVASGTLASTGVDQRVGGTLVFPGGVIAQWVCGFDATSDNALVVNGEHGSIRLPMRFWEGTRAVLALKDRAEVVCEAPFRINGFEGEVEEAMHCIGAGQLESPRMPHAETLALARWNHEVLRQLGVRYPFE
ncbi:MAG: Gfo/Idh/MocA family oxidoreductase [Betaproteobacteria bacterium]|nr:Gfo/Idh/MocA family oxidoreductase [Betaproteobacteria bacterium]